MYGFWSCSCKHCDWEKMKRKRQGEKKRKKSANTPPPSKTKKQNQPINQTNKKNKPLPICNLVWPDSQIENLGQNTGDLPPRTIADYSILHYKKKRGEETSRKCKWGLSCNKAQRATISEQQGFRSPSGNAVWQDKLTAVPSTVEHKGPGGSHLGLTAHAPSPLQLRVTISNNNRQYLHSPFQLKIPSQRRPLHL